MSEHLPGVVRWAIPRTVLDYSRDPDGVWRAQGAPAAVALGIVADLPPEPEEPEPSPLSLADLVAVLSTQEASE